MSKLVVVGGGSGFVGRSLCAALKKSGYEPIIVSRVSKGKPNTMTWDEVKTKGLPQNTAAVINLAGEPTLNPLKRWNNELERMMVESRVGTTKILRNAILSAKTPPLFWGTISGVGFYTPHKSLVYDETSNVSNEDFWSKLTVEWEEAGKLPAELNTRHCIVRSGVVLGKNGGALKQMWLPYQLCLGGAIGDGKQWFPWIHIQDLVGIFMYALTKDKVSGVLNGVAPEAKTNREFSQCFASALNRPAFIPMPSSVIQFLFGSPRANMLLEGQNVYPKQTLQSGYIYRFPKLMEALKDITNK